MRNKAETIRYMILKQCQRRSLTELCDAWEVTIDDFYAYLDSKDKLLGNTADDWMGMYHIAADRADKAEAEVERLKLMVKSITGGLDECMETVHFLEAENAKLLRVVDAAKDHLNTDVGSRAFKQTDIALGYALAKLDEADHD